MSYTWYIVGGVINIAEYERQGGRGYKKQWFINDVEGKKTEGLPVDKYVCEYYENLLFECNIMVVSADVYSRYQKSMESGDTNRVERLFDGGICYEDLFE